uniref:Uncharacterized protein n=1 Tax=Anguilla anguilla TaxID=7936 RepID=A0A0E9UXF5_ANGAN
MSLNGPCDLLKAIVCCQEANLSTGCPADTVTFYDREADKLSQFSPGSSNC